MNNDANRLPSSDELLDTLRTLPEGPARDRTKSEYREALQNEFDADLGHTTDQAVRNA